MQNERLSLKAHPVHIIRDLKNARNHMKWAYVNCGEAKSVTDYLDTALEAVNDAIKKVDDLLKP